MPAGSSTRVTAPDVVPARILGAERCHLGEGAAYDAGSDTAWWFDILERRLFEARLGTGEIAIHPLPLMASALAMTEDGRQILATEHGLMLREIASGALEMLAPVEADDAATRANDARVHPGGTFWFSTMGRKAEPGAGTIYAYRAGAVRPLFPGLTIPNAICFSPDGAAGFFADTAANTLHRVSLDPATGLPADAPLVIHRHRDGGGLDGAVVDASGLIWCAIWGGARLNAFSPAGDLVRSVVVPALQPSCPVFVGAGFDRVLVTTAFENMDEKARAADPHHGRTFLLDGGARGRGEPRVRLGGA